MVDRHYEEVAKLQFDFENPPVLLKPVVETARPVRRADGSIRLELENGVILNDFYHLGISGCFYKTWLPVEA